MQLIKKMELSRLRTACVRINKQPFGALTEREMKTIKELNTQMEKADSATARYELLKIIANRALKLEREVEKLKRLDNFKEGFYAGWMYWHCDIDADSDSIIEEVYSEFLSCRD